VSFPPTFTERLDHRDRIWWHSQHPNRRRRLTDRLHRVHESRTFRHRDDPATAWHCCEFWPRLLLNKYNGREFASRHGCVNPELLWWGSDHDAIPFDQLPSNFAIRPVWGTARRGVVVVAADRELIHGVPAEPQRLRAVLPRTKMLRRPMTVLVEEFVPDVTAADQLPVEIKAHTFVDEVAALEVQTRRGTQVDAYRFYARDWQPLQLEFYEGHPQDAPLREPPDWLDELLKQAARLGTAIGTYMRFDFFAGANGPVFNEFSSTPRWHPYTRELDEWFGRLWAEHCPDRL